MSDIINGLPSVREIDKQIVDVTERERRHLERSAASRERFQTALASWREKSVKALDAGQSFSEPAPGPDIGDAAHFSYLSALRAEADNLSRERLRAIVAAESEIEQQAHKVIDGLTPKARKLFSELEEIVTKIKAAQGSVRTVRDSRNALDPNRQVHYRNPDPLTIASLARMLDQDVDLLADVRDTTPRQLGMSRSNLHELPETAPEPPLLPEPPKQTNQLIPNPRGGFMRKVRR